jgi:hypothetical protein
LRQHLRQAAGAAASIQDARAREDGQQVAQDGRKRRGRDVLVKARGNVEVVKGWHGLF